MQTMMQPKRRLRWNAFLITLSIVAPFAAVMLSHWATKFDSDATVWSSATICGVIVGSLVGLKAGRMSRLMLGPAFGLAAGMLDLNFAVWTYQQLDWPMPVAAWIPVWSLVLGALVALDRPSWRSRCLIVGTIAVADFAFRWLWQQDFAMDGIQKFGQWRWIVSAIAFVPTSLLAVVLTVPSNRVATPLSSEEHS